MSKIVASFTVTGGTARTFNLDIADKTPGEIADLLDREFDGVSLCHQCSPECEDPEGELSSFTIDGVDYERRDGHWVTASREGVAR